MLRDIWRSTDFVRKYELVVATRISLGGAGCAMNELYDWLKPTP